MEQVPQKPIKKQNSKLNDGQLADNLEQFQHGKSVWEKNRANWINPNQKKIPKPEKYQQYEQLSMFDQPYIIDIIHSVKPPYQPFKKYVKLKDLVEVLEKAWDEDD